MDSIINNKKDLTKELHLSSTSDTELKDKRNIL